MTDAYEKFCDDNNLFNAHLRCDSPTDEEVKVLELECQIRSFFDDKADILLPLFMTIATKPFGTHGSVPDTEKLWLALLQRAFPEDECSIHSMTSPTTGPLLELHHNQSLILTVHFLPVILPDGPIIQHCHDAYYRNDRLGACEWVTVIKAFGLEYEHFRCVKSGGHHGGLRPFVRRDQFIERGGLDGFIDEGEGDVVVNVEDGMLPWESPIHNLLKYDGLSILEQLLLSVSELQFAKGEEDQDWLGLSSFRL